MLKVVICDDNIEDLISIEKMLVRFQTVHQQEQCEIEKFSDSNALYKKIILGFKADIYILDMLMPLKNGIDIGKLIRKQIRTVQSFIVRRQTTLHWRHIVYMPSDI